MVTASQSTVIQHPPPFSDGVWQASNAKCSSIGVAHSRPVHSYTSPCCPISVSWEMQNVNCRADSFGVRFRQTVCCSGKIPLGPDDEIKLRQRLYSKYWKPNKLRNVNLTHSRADRPVSFRRTETYTAATDFRFKHLLDIAVLSFNHKNKYFQKPFSLWYTGKPVIL